MHAYVYRDTNCKLYAYRYTVRTRYRYGMSQHALILLALNLRARHNNAAGGIGVLRPTSVVSK